MFASIKELKDQLSSYIDRVQHGEELIITLHKHPIAKIIPLTEPISEKKIIRKKFFAEIQTLHKHLKNKVSPETPLSKLVIEKRKEERY